MGNRVLYVERVAERQVHLLAIAQGHPPLLVDIDSKQGSASLPQTIHINQFQAQGTDNRVRNGPDPFGNVP
jgi:hypothetical protein